MNISFILITMIIYHKILLMMLYTNIVNFSINIQIEDIKLSFSSDVMRIDNESIQNFVYNFENNEPCYMTHLIVRMVHL